MTKSHMKQSQNDVKFFLNVASIAGLFLAALYIASPILKVVL